MDTAALPVPGNVTLDADLGPKSNRRSAPNVARLQDAAFASLSAVASYLDADDDLPSFLAWLSETIAEQIDAGRLAFWRLGPRGTLTLQPKPYGFGPDSPAYRVRVQLGRAGEGPIERVIFSDELDLVRGTSPELDALWRAHGLRDIKNSIAVSWRAGQRRIGALAAYDSLRGFNANDVWLLRLVGLAAGLMWQYKEAEDELGHTAVRLEEAMTARRHLLNNIAAGGDEARRRFASALHDDSLQLLTGAELQLERIRLDANGGRTTVALDQLKNTLRRVEDSLRRLLTNVSPETIQIPSDVKGAIRERLESMRIRSGIEADIDLRVPEDIPQAIQAIVVKNVAEALNNVEKHAHATRAVVKAEMVDSGIRVEVADNGTGFVVAESVHVPGHMGLLAMRERAQLAGGWCRIESDPGAGARISFWVPLSL